LNQVPRLETDRLVLRPFDAGDAADVFAYASDLEFGRYLGYPIPTSLADVEQFIARAQAGELGENLWAIMLKPLPTVIGAVQLDAEDSITMSAHYEIARRLWGQGLATEAARAALAWARENRPEVERIVADVHPENVGSRRVLEKLGLQAVGEAGRSVLYEKRLIPTA
jgi:ribosomal-protein-alanine N-acetyltransferase